MSAIPDQGESLVRADAATQIHEVVPSDAALVTMLEQPAHELMLVVSPDAGQAVAAESDVGTIKPAHPTIAMQIIFDRNTLNIPVGTPMEILTKPDALRRAYSIAMAQPALLQARMTQGETDIEGYTVPTLTLTPRTHVKGADPARLPDLVRGLRRVSRSKADQQQTRDRALVQALLAGDRHITVATAVDLSLGDCCGRILNPATNNGGDLALCRLLDAIPSVAAEAPQPSAW